MPVQLRQTETEKGGERKGEKWGGGNNPLLLGNPPPCPLHKPIVVVLHDQHCKTASKGERKPGCKRPQTPLVPVLLCGPPIS